MNRRTFFGMMAGAIAASAAALGFKQPAAEEIKEIEAYAGDPIDLQTLLSQIASQQLWEGWYGDSPLGVQEFRAEIDW